MRAIAMFGGTALSLAAAMAAHVGGWLAQAPVHHAPVQARLLTSPLDLADSDLDAGRATYAARCAGCHGEKGAGGVALAPNRPAPSDLTRADLRTHTDGEIYWVIANGIAGSGMPAATGLSETARWQLVAWMRNQHRALQPRWPGRLSRAEHRRARGD